MENDDILRNIYIILDSKYRLVTVDIYGEKVLGLTKITPANNLGSHKGVVATMLPVTKTLSGNHKSIPERVTCDYLPLSGAEFRSLTSQYGNYILKYIVQAMLVLEHSDGEFMGFN